MTLVAKSNTFSILIETMILENLNRLEEKITRKCEETGRKREEITLIAVSKLNPASAVSEASKAGQIHFGENKAQELDGKYTEVTEDVIWHFIGHLQTNKAKYVVKSAEYIHSVDSVKLAKEINKRAAKIDKVQKVLIEVNTSEEEQKFGLEREKGIEEVAQYCKEAENLKLCGLMTMAPYVAEDDVIRGCFKQLREIKEKLNEKGYGLTELSMGMTNDYEIAIEEGSTMLRIGTAIFGERDYGNK